jgi:hypothetical protein
MIKRRCTKIFNCILESTLGNAWIWSLFLCISPCSCWAILNPANLGPYVARILTPQHTNCRMPAHLIEQSIVSSLIFSSVQFIQCHSMFMCLLAPSFLNIKTAECPHLISNRLHPHIQYSFSSVQSSVDDFEKKKIGIVFLTTNKLQNARI